MDSEITSIINVSLNYVRSYTSIKEGVRRMRKLFEKNTGIITSGNDKHKKYITLMKKLIELKKNPQKTSFKRRIKYTKK